MFARLSDVIPELNTDGDLVNWNRIGKCHTKSREISSRLEISNEVVTGYFHTIADVTRYLHSWVEFSKSGEDYVIDYTMNVVMNKKGYYSLGHIKELCRIRNNEIISDFPLFSQFADLPLKIYLVFRHEMAKEIEQKITGKQLKKTYMYNPIKRN